MREQNARKQSLVPDRDAYISSLASVEKHRLEAAVRAQSETGAALEVAVEEHACFKAGLCLPASSRLKIVIVYTLVSLMSVFNNVLPARFCSACGTDLYPNLQSIGFTSSSALGGSGTVYFDNAMLTHLSYSQILTGQSMQGAAAHCITRAVLTFCLQAIMTFTRVLLWLFLAQGLILHNSSAVHSGISRTCRTGKKVSWPQPLRFLRNIRAAFLKLVQPARFLGILTATHNLKAWS